MKKLKRILCAIFAFLLVGVNIGSGIVPVLAIEGDSATVKNDPKGPTVLDDGVRLHKTARAVPGYANEWEVTLKIEAPAVTVTSDTVVVIDRSNSMSSDMLSRAKAAATSLAEELLPDGNRVNRVAVIAFGSEIVEKTNGFSDSFATVNNAINGPSGITANGGGTFTQGAIHAATQLLASSSATHKSIVLLSDGVPSYSYDINNVSGSDFEVGHEMIGTDSRQFKVMTTSDKYDYDTRVGDGSRYNWQEEGREMWDNYGNIWIGGRRYDGYYDHGNSAIAEANFFKATGGTLHTIAYNAGTLGNSVLGSMATDGKSHTSTGDDLEEIFDDIAGQISSLVGNSHVHDVMGEGVYIDNTTHAESLDWDPVFRFNSETNMYEATTTYRVSASEAMLEDSAHETEEGFHRLNKSASITYGDNKTGDFPVPYVKPFFVNVTKEIEGQECAEGECEFDFQIEHIATDHIHYDNSVKNGETHRIVEKFPVGDYVLTELGETTGSSNPVAFEYYTTTYTGNQFTINEEHADHIDVTIKNTYETVDLTASKVWDDDDNRDGLRGDYTNLYVVVKDGNNFVAHEKVTGATTQSFEFNGLPKNRNGSAIRYTLGEATCTGNEPALTCSDFDDSKYTSTVGEGNVITNSHTPDTTKLTIKKKWDTSAGTLPSTTPGFVTVEVSNDKNDSVKTITLQGENYAEWTGEFEDYKYENGEVINYSLKEKNIAGSILNSNNALYVYKDDVLEGKWVATYSGTEITNTWTPAETVYTGSGEFYIEKLDQDGQPLKDVTFTVGSDSYTTGDDGKVKILFSESTNEPEDKYTFDITETSAPSYYELISGTEVIEANTNLDLSVSEENLTNTYTKTFSYTVKTPIDGYVWQTDDKTVVVTDRALAKELRIEKTFDGLSTSAIENNSKIDFTITGPKGFDETTVGIGDDECSVSDSKLICVISGDDTILPVGKYTVTENNAEIANFTYESVPEDGKVSQTVELGKTAKFELKNIYTTVNDASYKVKKVWEDDSDRDGVRPDDLEVTLYADGEKYGSPVKLTADDDWTHEWTNLPLMNEDAEKIEYNVKEATVSDYVSDGGVMNGDVFVFTNTHTPEPYGDLTIEKIWKGDGNESVRPATIMIELYGEIVDDEGKTVTWLVGNPVEVSNATDWKWTFDELYKYENGKEVTYSVQESAIGGTSFGEDESTIVVYEDDGKVLKGKWEKMVSDYEITNTWTPAANVYNGKDEFSIKKINQDGETMKGVTFEVSDKENTEEYTTDKDGLIKVVVPEATGIAEDNLEYEVKETETVDGYDLVDGSATVKVKSNSTFVSADLDTMVNTFTKTYTYDVNGDAGYSWDGDDKVLTVVNERSMAKSLTIKKTFSGVSEIALQNLTFTVTGPEDFGDDGELTLKFSDDCTVSNNTATCKVDGDIPTGKYTVMEDGAEIKNFTLTVSGDNNKEKEIKKDDEAVFEIDNAYDVDKTSYTIVKLWDDAHDKDGVRPETLTVNLLADGEIVEVGELSEDYLVSASELPEDLADLDVWWYEFVELPVANEDAEVISYMAEEILDTKDYEQIETMGDDYAVLFVNHHEPKPEDPCANDGCDNQSLAPTAPDTGSFTNVENHNGSQASSWIGAMAAVLLVIISISVSGFTDIKKH
ncbi:Cna B-type domain-containing protein [Candidatus Saccharibacteria bacterium]|nr:Cna B-type domain-containing protein [Candidatus Saccharibacteria bacterium]